jgi:acetyl esterase/lipase
VNAGADDPAIERVIERVRGVYGRWNRKTSIDQMRHDWDTLFWSDQVPSRIEDLQADGVPVRWIDADGARREHVLLYFHGGGYKMGSVVSHHDLMARLSLAAQCRVLGVNYRLLPEHGFPAPVEDAVAAYRWLIGQGVDARHIALAGDSAGGGLVAATLMALREQGHVLPAAGVMLSAWTDLEATAIRWPRRSLAGWKACRRCCCRSAIVKPVWTIPPVLPRRPAAPVSRSNLKYGTA